MTMFEPTWLPKIPSDLVFGNRDLEDYVMMCVKHNRTPDHMLLFGPAGTGKTVTLKVLADHFANSGMPLAPTIDQIPASLSENEIIKRLTGAFETATNDFASPTWFLFDEFDRIGKSQTQLKLLMDVPTKSRIFATTNKINVIESPMLNRFQSFEAKVPTPKDMLARTKAILQAELPEKTIPDEMILHGLEKFCRNSNASLRDMMRSISGFIEYVQQKRSINPWDI
jgi:replication-associated recombination protein RarA